MSKITAYMFAVLTMFVCIVPGAYAINYVSFSASVTKIMLQTGVAYDGDVLVYVNNPASERTFSANGIVCDGLWLDKNDTLHTKYGLSLLLSAINTKAKISVVAQDDKWAGSGAYFCKVSSLSLLG